MTEEQIVSIICDMIDTYDKIIDNYAGYGVKYDLMWEANGAYKCLCCLLENLGYRYNMDTDMFVK